MTALAKKEYAVYNQNDSIFRRNPSVSAAVSKGGEPALLSTKLIMPRPRRDYIVRRALFEKLKRCSEMSVVFVKGAAGMGKTTLLSSFFVETGLKNTAWLSLDESNNGLFSFWRYFAAAAGSLVGELEFGPAPAPIFELREPKKNLIFLINRLCGDTDYYMVLDDFHCITNPALIDSLEFFLQSMPENLHLFLLSREDPPVYLGALAVSGRLLYLSGEDMKLSQEESIQFLKKTMKLRYDEAELKKISGFAEGWVGGLQLAAAGGEFSDDLLKKSGGFAAEYLTREVFGKLSSEEQSFLIRTGILPWFDADICSALFESLDYASMLENLLNKNLFLICIDEKKEIYRYHNILGEYLKQRFSELPAVSADEVRASGLLKDRIVITYPEGDSINNDMAILQAAADDWKEKWDHWTQYCREQHYPYVNPVFIIQVLNGSGTKLTDTDLDDCLSKIEERTGFKFEAGQVVHTFGQTTSTIPVNGLDVRYEEPSRIADDRNIRVVFFKENLSTGWDCPRAETMASFKHANDATYIAQLLGRMVRTPMQSHIQVDDVLNDVHLYLPYFNENTVEDVVEALQSSEGGDIPTDIYGESLTGKRFETLTVRPRNKKDPAYDPNQTTLEMFYDASHNIQSGATSETQESAPASMGTQSAATVAEAPASAVNQPTASTSPMPLAFSEVSNSYHANPVAVTSSVQPVQEESAEDLFDREEVMKFINDAGLLSYNVRAVRISNYLSSLYKMAHLLTMSKLRRDAIREIQEEIVQMIHDYVENLKAKGTYDDLVLQVKQFKLATQIFDAFGETVDNYSVHDLFTTTDTDIERQFRIADAKLGNEGIGMAYGNKYTSFSDLTAFKVDVILFVADEDCMNKLHSYAEARFHGLNDDYRRYIATIDSEKIRRQYDSIVSDGDVVSKHNFRLPETIQVPHEAGGKEYRDHLFVNDDTGVATMKLNSWEAGVIEEEEKRADFVCWIRNPSRGSWALCIPYEIDGEIRPTYPDFIIVRKDERLGFVIDILEPHNSDFKDNLGKAKGFAEYARQNPGVGRIQLIRMGTDPAGKKRFRRLDMYRSMIRDKVSHAVSNDELDHIFENDGFFD